MKEDEMKALETVRKELCRLKEKYQKKSVKEREKVSDVYITVCDEKCYTEDDINSWYECDYITCEQSDRYIERLNKKKEKAGLMCDTLTKSEKVCENMDNMINNFTHEIKDIQSDIDKERKKEERWKIAQEQGCSYQQFLELEEISRQSEEYELVHGMT